MRSLVLAILVIGILLFGACTKSLTASHPGAIAISAEELYSTYEQDEKAGDVKYKDKLLEVSGVITSVDEDILPVPYIMLYGGGVYESLGVQCLFDEEYEPLLSDLRNGETVVVLGVCDGFAMDVILKDCILIE